MRARVLPTRRGRREGHTRYQYPPLTRCVPPPRLQDSPAHVARAAPHSQVLAVYLHHEHRQYFSHGYHNQLELPRSQDASYAALDPRGLPLLPSHRPAHEAAQEDEAALDDGDARHVRTSAPLVRQSGRAAKASAPLGAGQEQNGGDGAVRPPSPKL